jgi:hypothetical protein
VGLKQRWGWAKGQSDTSVRKATASVMAQARGAVLAGL